jgi:two-component system, sensor histidine kinase and response regulator
MRPLTVLVAEDNPVNQKLAIALLRRRNAVVTIATNGVEAVSLWASGDYDLVLMDIQMPEMDGLEACGIIRSRELTGQRIPIVAVTARAMTGDREECLAAGMDAYLSKPIRSAELLETIDRLVATRATTTAPAADVFDIGQLRSNVGDDEALISELLELFASEATTHVAAICDAAAAGDAKTMHLAAHTLKGAASAITAARVAHAAGTIEQLARAGALDGVASSIGDLRSELAVLEGRLRAVGAVHLAVA